MGIAEQMGRVLQRTSISVNIKERLDFYCALFDNRGLGTRASSALKSRPKLTGWLTASVLGGCSSVATTEACLQDRESCCCTCQKGGRTPHRCFCKLPALLPVAVQYRTHVTLNIQSLV